MELWIQISSGSDEPIYLQIAEQISRAIAKDELKAGDRLPAVRKLAADLVINPNTAARAYSQLEQAGLVVTKTGSGTFVSDPKQRLGGAIEIDMLAERIDAVIARGLNLGIGARDLVAMFKGRMERFVHIRRAGRKK